MTARDVLLFQAFRRTKVAEGLRPETNLEDTTIRQKSTGISGLSDLGSLNKCMDD